MLLQKLLYGNSYAAVEHYTDSSGEEAFSILILQKNKDELTIKNSCKTTSFEKVTSILSKEKHVFIIFNSQQILEKKVERTENISNAIYSAFPNITVEEFYHELYSSASNDLIAVSRKEYIDGILKKYKDNKISIIGFSLGNLSITNLLPYLNNQEQLSTSNATIQISNREILAISRTVPSEISYQINELKVTNTELLCLSGILSYYAKNHNNATNPYPNIELTKEFEQGRIFKTGIQYGLILLLSILLINFVFFNKYYSKVNALQTQMQMLDTQKKQLKELKSAIQKKEKLVTSLEKISNSKVSFYIDQIAKEIPNSILLQQINYQPILSKIRKDKSIKNRKNSIIIIGKSSDSKKFTNFIEILENKKWIKQVIVIDLTEEKKGLALFEIEINIATDE